MPLFALGNAGVIVDSSMLEQLNNPVVVGIIGSVIMMRSPVSNKNDELNI